MRPFPKRPDILLFLLDDIIFFDVGNTKAARTGRSFYYETARYPKGSPWSGRRRLLHHAHPGLHSIELGGFFFIIQWLYHYLPKPASSFASGLRLLSNDLFFHGGRPSPRLHLVNSMEWDVHGELIADVHVLEGFAGRAL